MGAFEYRQAEEIRNAFSRHAVRYLFIGKSGAILLGFPDTTQDTDLFVDRSPENCRAAIAALGELGPALGIEPARRGEIASPLPDLFQFPGWRPGTGWSSRT